MPRQGEAGTSQGEGSPLKGAACTCEGASMPWQGEAGTSQGEAGTRQGEGSPSQEAGPFLFAGSAAILAAQGRLEAGAPSECTGTPGPISQSKTQKEFSGTARPTGQTAREADPPSP